LWELKIATLVNIDEHARTLALVAVGYNRIGKFDWSTAAQANVYTAAANRKKLAARGSRLIVGTFAPPEGKLSHQEEKC
jgi:hypothetical protein